MRLSEFIEGQPHGAISQLAAAVAAHVPDVSRWVSGKRPVPIAKCAAIERFTAGAVTRRDLRPDDAHLIWPDLDDADPNPAPALAQQAQAAINGVAVGEGA